MSFLDPDVNSSTHTPTVFIKQYIANLSKLLANLNTTPLEKIIASFEAARKHSKTIFFIGNGGSAATASHFANDLRSVSVNSGEPSYKALSLTDSSTALTQLANDTGFENVFLTQLESFFEPGDVLVAISASGNSINILKAVKYANAQGGVTIGLSGFDGGKLKEMCEICFHVSTPKEAYGPVEDIHMMVDHLITTHLRLRSLESRQATKIPKSK